MDLTTAMTILECEVCGLTSDVAPEEESIFLHALPIESFLDIGVQYQQVIHVHFLKMASNRVSEFMAGDLLLAFCDLHSLENNAFNI